MSVNVYRNLSAAGVWAAPGQSFSGPGYKIVRLPSGPPGARGEDAATGFGFGYQDFGAAALLNGVCPAYSVIGSQAVSVAYTARPPTTIPQVVTLYKNGSPIGTATFSVGVNLGALSIGGGSVTFAPTDFPQFGAPAVLDPNFSHFAVTYAS